MLLEIVLCVMSHARTIGGRTRSSDKGMGCGALARMRDCAIAHNSQLRSARRETRAHRSPSCSMSASDGSAVSIGLSWMKLPS
jgi:hypothetical protein